MDKKPSVLFPLALLVGGALVIVGVIALISVAPNRMSPHPPGGPLFPADEAANVAEEVAPFVKPKVFPSEPDTSLLVPLVEDPVVEVVPAKPSIPEWGNELLGEDTKLEDEQGLEYAKDENGELTAEGKHGGVILPFPDKRYDTLLGPGQRAALYRRLSEPRRQVVEFVGRKAEDLDRALVAKLAEDDLRLWNGPVQTKNGVAFLFVTAKELKELQDRKEYEEEMEARRKK